MQNLKIVTFDLNIRCIDLKFSFPKISNFGFGELFKIACCIITRKMMLLKILPIRDKLEIPNIELYEHMGILMLRRTDVTKSF